MSGIFGTVSKKQTNKNDFNTIVNHNLQRGKGLSGIVHGQLSGYKSKTNNSNLMKTLNDIDLGMNNVIAGYTSDPMVNKKHRSSMWIKEEAGIIYDGILLNENELSSSEMILNLLVEHYQKYGNFDNVVKDVFENLEGAVTVVAIFVRLGKIICYSNIGSLYIGKKNEEIYFSSERYPLKEISCFKIEQVLNNIVQIEIPKSNRIDSLIEEQEQSKLISLSHLKLKEQEKMLKYRTHNIRRCTKCILPETMPFIYFDSEGVCNYCKSYKKKNIPRPKEELFKLVEPYRKKEGVDCIVPFSGGRDSSYGLHLTVKELGMKPITYTYDWGMVTDIGHKNISRMSAELGVENIVVVADIKRKRMNIEKNLKAWLKSPHLGMVSVLTAGDKHFFKYINTIKKQTGINLNLWGVNPMEVTHFKAGFLGVKPNFENNRVYMSGAFNQLKYQTLRLKAMSESLGYFNSSLWDTLSGEYYRSFSKKEDYYHIFDYWQWDEKIVDDTLREYNWEVAPDTTTTWRIGDGTAGLCNYIYYTVAGFTEHDTFRSNQIREGLVTREEALELVKVENRPRYENISWYLNTLKMDFKEVIDVINSIPKLYDVELED